MQRRVVAGVLVAVLGLVAALLVVRDNGDGDGLDRARHLLDDDSAFGTSFEAADALARIGEWLQADGEACRDRAGAGSRSCASLLEAAAAAQVMAYRVLDCTGPGRFDARTRLATHLDALARDADPGDPPGPPRCE